MTREISRQAFIRGALGSAAATALASCRTPVHGPQVQPTNSAAPSPAEASGPQNWAALEDAIEGHVLLPSNPDYATAKSLFNALFDDSTPAAVVTAQSTDDIRRAVEFAARKDIKVTVRSGGHSYTGASAADGAMVIDLRRLPGEPTQDRELVTIPAAAQLDSVQTALAAEGLSIPSGSCPTVGVAGLTLGGGLGSDARRAGLTCDALASAVVVLPSGEVITASADEHAEVFWALRGGGGGAVGVVASLTFRTFPTAERDVVTVEFPEDATADVVLGWHDWLQSADRAIWGMVNITVGAGSAGCTVVLATPAGDGPHRASQFSAAAGVQSTNTTTRTLGRMDFVRYFEGGSQAARPRAFVAGSDIIGEMTREAAESIAAATTAWPLDAGSATAVIESLSGAVQDPGPGDAAFPWRRAAACVQWYTEPSATRIDTAHRWLTSAHTSVQAHSVGRYVNYAEPDTRPSLYFGANLQRLGAVHRKYDPTGLMCSLM
jgi:FAD/FMN-containing dehydrogenase